MSSHVSIEALPLELLSHICDLIGSTHKPSLVNFASCSSALYSVAKQVIYRHVEVRIDDPEFRFNSVQECLASLEQAKALESVHTLKITGLIDEAIFLSSLTALMRRCTVLCNLILDSSHRIPLSFLAILQQYRHRIKLNIITNQPLKTHEDDQYELSLTTSSQLHSISFRKQDGWPQSAYHMQTHQTALRILALAPGLKKIHLYRGGNYEHPLKTDGSEKARLKVLELDGRVIYPDELRSWNSHIDFSFLRELNLKSPTRAAALHYLSTSCSFPVLKSLTLGLKGYHEDHGHNLQKPIKGSEFDMSYSEETLLHEFEILGSEPAGPWLTEKVFFIGLPPLTSLDLYLCCRPTTLLVILKHHGPTLRSLKLPRRNHPICPPEKIIENVQLYCPRLENLTLQIPRSNVNPKEEVDMYKSLGSLPKLQNLSITLIVPYAKHPYLGTMATAEYPSSTDPWDQEIHIEHSQRNLRHGHVREIFKYGALDRALAVSIFNCINSAKPMSCPLLRCLRLGVDAGFLFDQGGVTDKVFRHVARSWMVVGTRRFDGGMVVEARDRGPVVDDGQEVVLGSEMEEIFERNWGVGTKGLDWRTGWCGVPLLGV